MDVPDNCLRARPQFPCRLCQGMFDRASY